MVVVVVQVELPPLARAAAQDLDAATDGYRLGVTGAVAWVLGSTHDVKRCMRATICR